MGRLIAVMYTCLLVDDRGPVEGREGGIEFLAQVSEDHGGLEEAVLGPSAGNYGAPMARSQA